MRFGSLSFALWGLAAVCSIEAGSLWPLGGLFVLVALAEVWKGRRAARLIRAERQKEEDRGS